MDRTYSDLRWYHCPPHPPPPLLLPLTGQRLGFIGARTATPVLRPWHRGLPRLEPPPVATIARP